MPVDDNVHVMNTLELAAKLEEIDKHFEMMLYPGNTPNMLGPKLSHDNDLEIRF
jgi:dipeptidyl-peptidase-4